MMRAGPSLSCPQYLQYLYFFIAVASAAPSPREVKWGKAYGPDGPWNAINVGFGTKADGSSAQYFDAYPGGMWSSTIITADLCSNVLPKSAECQALDAGVYSPDVSTTAQVVGATFKDQWLVGVQYLYASGGFRLDTLALPGARAPVAEYHIPHHSAVCLSQGLRELPNGTRYSISMSTITLGAPEAVQFYGRIDINGSMTTYEPFSTGLTPSNSYGLHIGAAGFKLPGSLFLGGYDKHRVTGPVSAQPYGYSSLDIDLLDISIAVAVGSSPFGFNSKSGLLSQGNSSLSSMPQLNIEVDAKEPYLYLPESTCAAIAANLPVTHRPDLGLYLWNANDPSYKRIVESPAYLGFTFRANNSATQNITIKVPFRLLSLTLTEPLADTPTPYFPCSHPTLPNYRLGRAFLQAAFVAVNYMTDANGPWFLAQAPGPNIGTLAEPVAIRPVDRSISTSDTAWVDSWQGFWTPLAPDGSPDPAATRTTNGTGGAQPTGTDLPHTSSGSGGPSTGDASADGLSTGFIAGLSVMAVVIAVSCAAAVAWLLRRRRRRLTSGAEYEKATREGAAETANVGPGSPAEIAGNPRSEMSHWQTQQEMIRAVSYADNNSPGSGTLLLAIQSYLSPVELDAGEEY